MATARGISDTLSIIIYTESHGGSGSVARVVAALSVSFIMFHCDSSWVMIIHLRIHLLLILSAPSSSTTLSLHPQLVGTVEYGHYIDTQ